MTKEILYSNKGGGLGSGEVEVTEKSSALAGQQDGDHYTKMKKQPLQLAYELNASPCFLKLSKYSVRDKQTKIGDLKKAKHCIQLEKELISIYGNSYIQLRKEPEFVFEKIKEFTEDLEVQAALERMYFGFYDEAVGFIEELIYCYEEYK